ncbi:MAG: Tn3 family transposase [Specibacter sp.]
MPVEFLSDDQIAVYGQFSGPVSPAELERFFFLDDQDLELVGRRRGEGSQLGLGVQLGTLRFLGTFLDNPVAVPEAVINFVATQLGIVDSSVLGSYVERSKTPYEHRWEIARAYGYRRFSEPETAEEFRSFLTARAWTRAERPTQLFDQGVAWLRAERVLLPGVSVLARLVAEVRAMAGDRLYSVLSGRVSPDLGRCLDGLLTVPADSRSSGLERLRRAPTRASGPEMVRALERVAEIAGLGAGDVDLSEIPAGRVQVLARQGLSSDAAMLRRMPKHRRWATMVATAGVLRVSAVDDVLDLFSVLMATKLIGPAVRATAKDRLRSLPQLRRASVTLAAAAKAMLECAEGEGVDPAEAWTRLQTKVSREGLMAAVATVEELAPDSGDDADQGQAELVKRYATVRPFAALIAKVLPLAATPACTPLLNAVKGLGNLVGRKRVTRAEIVDEVVAGSWRRLVFTTSESADELVDHRAYTLCVLEALHRALRRRDLYAVDSLRWGDPRARLLDGEAWEQARPEVLTALRLQDPVDTHLGNLAARLDTAYTDLAARILPAETTSSTVPIRLEKGPDGRTRVHQSRLEAVPEPETLTVLRDTVERMLPRVDLPDVLLEVNAWTGYLDDFTHLGMTEQASGSRLTDLATSMAAVLVAEGCNLGFAPVIKHGHPALSRRRLSHVAQNYLRSDTLVAANARLIDAQAGVPTAQAWGGGLVASVGGLRFVVPVRTLDAGPNPHYFGQGRGVTWLNAINDQVSGIGAVVVTGTMRDSLHVLDVILNRDGGPAPQMIATDTASYSDIVFGLFRLLGYQFSPRLADMPDQRLWRLTVPDGRAADYGALNAVATNKLSAKRIRAQWADMLRVVGSLHSGSVAGYDLLRMLGRDGNPTPLGAAFADYGRAAKTLHLLAMYDPDDESYRRSIHVQLTVQESRHRMARKIFYGQRGELRQRYREGQEDQLGALGLVLNAVILWNTRYIDAALTVLREQGHPVDDTDVARLSPLGDAHINVHGRYAFTTLSDASLRPLRDPESITEDE